MTKRIRIRRLLGKYGGKTLLGVAVILLLAGLFVSALIIAHNDQWNYFSRLNCCSTKIDPSLQTSPSTMFQNLAVLMGTLVAAVWAIWVFLINRDAEAALDLELHGDLISWDASSMHGEVFLDVFVQNTGKGKMQAMPLQYPLKDLREYQNDDPDKQLPYSGTLEIKSYAAGAPNWHSGSSASSFSVNLLDSYEKDGKPEFWMEPGEKYHLGQVVGLKAGRYWARIVIVGVLEGEFWTRLFYLSLDQGLLRVLPMSESPQAE